MKPQLPVVRIHGLLLLHNKKKFYYDDVGWRHTIIISLFKLGSFKVAPKQKINKLK